VLLVAAGRPRSPATMPGFHAGRPPRNKGRRYPADPPTVEEIVAVMRAAGDRRHGCRMRGLIVVLWRAGLRIHEALALNESDLDHRAAPCVCAAVRRAPRRSRHRRVGLGAPAAVDRCAPRTSEAKQALDAERAARAKKIPRDRGDRLVECRRRLRQDWELERYVVTEHAAWHAAGIASDGSRRTAGARHNIKPYPLAAEPAGKINVTDPDSRNLKTTRGWVQGYNAQAVVGEGQIVLAAEISVESLDTASLQPMIETAIRELAGARCH